MDRLLVIAILGIWVSTVTLIGIWLVDDEIITLDFLDNFTKNYILIENQIYLIDISPIESVYFSSFMDNISLH
ncbi:MAG: hypothetical protein DWQ18_07900 [Crenarchaeota archaeon]|nr:MAG: hypothetical protein DWQ17_01885 [Thermoproteota archaeon]RDJ33085.1 MAG: hypothetical protein DWQ18_07900 [Thermoproteota archaeon]RDJ36411.1 MAG: hypothetical protein DWQ19_07420 [Thermoproteota archaeon]RDJ39040.1 MAG: hypothetical protein DWQ13_01885 [Thermoproteota archaeon]